jgi:uncharacterized protein (UPF0332 family)
MDSMAEVYLKRARSEIESAEILFEASRKKEIKDVFNISEDSSFYSGVISHAYYSIFYCAKAMLLTKNVVTKPPEIHRKTFEEFKSIFIDTGLLGVKLLYIYREMVVRAEMLLEIYRIEKGKRGKFTYNIIPQANEYPAQESIKNAKTFYKHCSSYLHSVNNHYATA